MSQIQTLLRREAQRAQIPIPKSRLPLFIGRVQAGHIERDCALWLASWCDQFALDGDRAYFPHLPAPELTELLSKVSEGFRHAGRVLAWRGELLPVVPYEATAPEPRMAAIERAMCRPFAFSTFASHLNVFTSDGRMWVGRRSEKKAIAPGYFDNCAAGMIPLGETAEGAMQREAFEEAGIIEGSMRFNYVAHHLNSRPLKEGWMREHTFIFEAVAPKDFRPINQDGEVSEFRLLEAGEILSLIAEHRFTLESALSILISLAGRHGLSTALADYI